MRDADSIELPPWACASPARRAHIARVTALLDSWAAAMQLSGEEAAAWHDAGRMHDALRDASENELRELLSDSSTPGPLLHGPAAALMLGRDGEERKDVLEAVARHTTGSPGWSRTGRALYMADFLEPGRGFAQAERSRIAMTVPDDFTGALRQVVRMRIEGALRNRAAIAPATVAMWNEVRR